MLKDRLLLELGTAAAVLSAESVKGPPLLKSPTSLYNLTPIPTKEGVRKRKPDISQIGVNVPGIYGKVTKSTVSYTPVLLLIVRLDRMV